MKTAKQQQTELVSIDELLKRADADIDEAKAVKNFLARHYGNAEPQPALKLVHSRKPKAQTRRKKISPHTKTHRKVTPEQYHGIISLWQSGMTEAEVGEAVKDWWGEGKPVKYSTIHGYVWQGLGFPGLSKALPDRKRVVQRNGRWIIKP